MYGANPHWVYSAPVWGAVDWGNFYWASGATPQSIKFVLGAKSKCRTGHLEFKYPFTTKDSDDNFWLMGGSPRIKYCSVVWWELYEQIPRTTEVD